MRRIQKRCTRASESAHQGSTGFVTQAKQLEYQCCVLETSTTMSTGSKLADKRLHGRPREDCYIVYQRSRGSGENGVSLNVRH